MSKHICLCCDTVVDIDPPFMTCPNCHSTENDMFEELDEGKVCKVCDGTGEGKNSIYCHSCEGSGRREV